jgi:uncharacterized protein
MRIGILSDTHGRTDAMAAAVRLLQDRGAQYLIHCGDLGSEQVLDFLAAIPSAFVWGNCDYDRTALQRSAEFLGIHCYGAFAHLTLDGKEIAVLHGDDHRLWSKIIEEQRHDYLLHGHTHVADDRRIGRTRVINPGALCRANPRSVAVLDTAADAVEFLSLQQP